MVEGRGGSPPIPPLPPASPRGDRALALRQRALHQARLRRAYDQLLNAGTVRPQGSDEVTNSGTRSGDYTPAR